MGRGITLIELLISVAIIAVVVVLSFSGFSSFRESSYMNESHSTVLRIIKDARSRTLSSEKNSQYGVHFENTRVVLFSGNSYNSGALSNEAYLFPALVRISAINLGGPVDIVFERLTGNALAFGTITLQSVYNSSKTKIITIISSGAIE